jgi:hypothetical protein
VPTILFDPLSRRVARWLKEWDANSLLRKRLSYPAHERMLRSAGERPVLFLSFVLLVCVAIQVLTGWVLPNVLGVSLVPSRWKEPELLTYFATLWAVQATIAALVYPVVIAFVAVLFQRRATAKLSLRLYALDAAVIPAGSSALALLAWIGVQYACLSYAPIEWLAPAMAGNVAWFLFNVALTGWFLYRTVRFLDDEARSEVFERFAVHVAFVREVRQHMFGLMFSNAQSDKALPGEAYGSDNRGPKVLLFPTTQGTPCLTIRLFSPRVVADVRLRLMRWGISLWLRKARKISCTPHGRKRSRDPVLSINIALGKVVDESLVLCTVQDGPSLGFLARFLVRHSVIFGRAPNTYASYSTAEILEELSVDALELAERKRFEAASETMRAIADLHAALIKSGAFTNNVGESDNAALLPDPYRFGSRRIHEHWLDAYRSLAETAVRNLRSDVTLYQRHCYLAFRLINAVRADHVNILIYALHISTYLMYRLGLWWAERIEDAGVLRHDPIRGAVLNPPLSGLYDRSLQYFIGSWEELALTYADVNAKTDDDAWREHARYAGFIKAHADETVHMLLSAVLRGDRAAAVWFADSLLKWWNRIEHRYDQWGLSAERGALLLTVAATRQKWRDVRTALRDLPQSAIEHIQPSQVIATILRRYATDLRLIVICILLDWTAEHASPDAFAVELVIALTQGRNLKHGGEVTADRVLEPASVLFRLLRMQLADDEYEQMLDKVIDRAQDLRKPDMVSGRIHSSAGADDIRSLGVAQVQLLTSVASSEIQSTRDIESALQLWGTDLQKLVRVKDVLRQLQECIGSDPFRNRMPATIAARAGMGLPNNIAEAEQWIRAMLVRIAATADQTQGALLASAVVSRDILNEFGSAVSSYVLGESNQIFPFTLKPEFEQCPLAVKSRSFSFSGVGKIGFTNLRSGSESDSWLSHHIADAIARGIVADYVHATAATAIEGEAEAAFFADMDTRANSLRACGESPLLLVPHTDSPEWVRLWTYHGRPRTEDGRVSFEPRQADDPPTYIGSFNRVPAHEMPLGGGRCYVLPMEHFMKLQYAPGPNEACVSVTHVDMGENTLKLTFEWKFRSAATPHIDSELEMGAVPVASGQSNGDFDEVLEETPRTK